MHATPKYHNATSKVLIASYVASLALLCYELNITILQEPNGRSTRTMTFQPQLTVRPDQLEILLHESTGYNYS